MSAPFLICHCPFDKANYQHTDRMPLMEICDHCVFSYRYHCGCRNKSCRHSGQCSAASWTFRQTGDSKLPCFLILNDTFGQVKSSRSVDQGVKDNCSNHDHDCLDFSGDLEVLNHNKTYGALRLPQRSAVRENCTLPLRHIPFCRKRTIRLIG